MYFSFFQNHIFSP